MTCDLCQRQLLLSEDPENPDLEVSAHLAECQACRDRQRQLAQIEHNVGRLPAPASSPQAFLDKFLSDLLKKDQQLAGQPDKTPPDPEKDKSGPDNNQEKETPKRQPALNPLVASLLDSDLQLAEAESPRQRVEELAKIARALNG